MIIWCKQSYHPMQTPFSARLGDCAQNNDPRLGGGEKSLGTRLRSQDLLGTYEAGSIQQKLNGSARSKRKSFEKSGPPFEVANVFRLDRSDRKWPLHSTFSTHFQSQYLAVRHFPSVLLVHTCSLCYAMYVLAVKNGPERLSNILSLFESSVRRSWKIRDATAVRCGRK